MWRETEGAGRPFVRPRCGPNLVQRRMGQGWGEKLGGIALDHSVQQV